MKGMKKDKTITKVVFFYHETNNDLFALFPEIHESGDMKLSYSHIGQHSACSWGYCDECRAAKPAEYKELKKELESLGYNLKIERYDLIN